MSNVQIVLQSFKRKQLFSLTLFPLKLRADWYFKTWTLLRNVDFSLLLLKEYVYCLQSVLAFSKEHTKAIVDLNLGFGRGTYRTGSGLWGLAIGG